MTRGRVSCTRSRKASPFIFGMTWSQMTSSTSSPAAEMSSMSARASSADSAHSTRWVAPKRRVSWAES